MQNLFWINIFLVVYSYVFYPLLLVFLKRFKMKKPIVDPDIWPGVSVVVSVYNEEKVIRQRIENCLALDYPQDLLEVVIASDGSDDATNAIVASYKDQGIKIYDYQQRRGKVNVLNETIPQLKHEIVVFSDANTIFQPDAIKKLVRNFNDSQVGCVCGRLQFTNAPGSQTGELEGVYWKLETFLKTSEGGFGAALGANGGIFALRKTLFFKCPSDTIVEDFVVPMKILEQGYQVIYEPEALATEEAAKDVARETQRRIRIGAGDFQALLMLWRMLNPLRGFPALAFWSHKVLRWLTPFFLLGVFVFNIFLLTEPFYKILFVLQGGFYGCAWLGGFLGQGEGIKRFLNLCHYFVAMNWALFLGFVKFAMGTQKVTWQRTER